MPISYSPPEIDPSYIYLSLHQREDGTIYIADQDGRQVKGLRSINPNLAFDEVATCGVDLVLFRPGTAEKYVNKSVKK
jgi:hypothetical protein